MAKLYYKYGTMNSSKSANLLMTAHNYELQGKRVLCLKSAKDSRWVTGEIQSRALAEGRPCKNFSVTQDLFKLIYDEQQGQAKIDAVLVDEAQFLSKGQVRQLAQVADKYDIPVLCFGLKNTYVDGELFEGSAALLYYADSIEEIKTVCQYCRKKATMNLFTANGQPVYSGNTLNLGDIGAKTTDTKYTQVCRFHYMNPPMEVVKSVATPYIKSKTEELKEQGIYEIVTELDMNKCRTRFMGLDTLDNLEYIVVGDFKLELAPKGKKKTGRSITAALLNFVFAYYKDPAECYDCFKSLNNMTAYFELYSPETYAQKRVTEISDNKNAKIFDLPGGYAYFYDVRNKDLDFFWNYIIDLFCNRQSESLRFYFVYSKDIPFTKN